MPTKIARDQAAVLVALATVLLSILGSALASGAGYHNNPPIIGGEQRHGLVDLAEQAYYGNYDYDSSTAYVQEIYADQGIDVTEDYQEIAYIVDDPEIGDIVDGGRYTGILVDEDTALGVPKGGGRVQIMRVTTEDIYRVDW